MLVCAASVPSKWNVPLLKHSANPGAEVESGARFCAMACEVEIAHRPNLEEKMPARKQIARTSTNFTRVSGKNFYNRTFSKGDQIASKSSMRRAAIKYMETAQDDCAYYECWIENNRWHFEPI